MPRLSVTGTFFSTVPRNPSITRPFRPFEIRTAFVYKRFGFGFGFGFAQRRAVPSYRDEQARSKRIAMESGNGNDNNNDASSNSKDQDSEDVGARVNYSMNRDDRSMATRHRNFSQNSQFRGKRIPTSWERPFGNEWLVAGNANETDPVCNRCFENLIHQWHNSRNRSPDRNAAGKRFDFSNDSEPADRNGRHSYTALGHGPSVCEDVGECMEMEKRSRDRALSICQAYIRRTPRYSLVKQLNNLGSRVDKHWFAVRDVSLKTDRLITLAPLSSNCSLIVSSLTKNILSDLFLALQHPYICPIFDIDFLEYERENYVIVVQPISQGSLKDLIYGVIELLKYIFGEPTSRRRNIEELLVHDLFRNIDLREMRCAPVTSLGLGHGRCRCFVSAQTGHGLRTFAARRNLQRAFEHGCIIPWEQCFFSRRDDSIGKRVVAVSRVSYIHMYIIYSYLSVPSAKHIREFHIRILYDFTGRDRFSKGNITERRNA
ncbi:slowpoke binding protein isoform X8 [Nomia melanderi]|uniref:slowpoke binding protein isoform X8 n=1 Tax=Nomia melanderi TaxID=2448451 RepID=UPI003FCE87CE